MQSPPFPYTFFLPFGPLQHNYVPLPVFPQYPQNQLHYFSSQQPLQNSQAIKQEQPESNKEVQIQNFGLVEKKESFKKSKPRKSHKSKVFEEWPQRIQTPNRNICSSTIHLYLKSVRSLNSTTFKSLKKIIAENKFSLSNIEFIETLNEHLPSSQGYISLAQLKDLVDGKKTRKSFARVLQISLKTFYLQELRRLEIRHGRRAKEIRNMQIKKGEEILAQLELD